MNYYAVIDTNVLVSSLLKHDSMPGKVIDLVVAKIIIPLVNNEIMNEYLDVLTRNKFGFSEDIINSAINDIKEKAIYLTREKTDEIIKDADDIVFYEIVMSARTTMDAYLVTGNIKDYPIKSYVVTPAQMIEIIESNDDSIT